MNWKTKVKDYFALQEINIDKKVLTVFISTAIILVLSEYYDSTSEINSLINWIFGQDISKKYDSFTLINGDYNFQNLLNWGFNCIVVFLLLPIFIVKIIFKENLFAYGFQFKGIRKHLWIYILLIIVMIPIVFFISKTPAFLNKYPFYHITQKEQLRYLLIWEIIYILQFISIEFFFRGFLLHSIKHKFGYYAVLIAMIPYCMIHFGKPISETFGAIIAGGVLGFLSLNTNSIWLGILVHVTVAITMDFCALWNNGIFN